MSKDLEDWDNFTVDEIAKDASQGTDPTTSPVERPGVRWSLIGSLVLLTALAILAAQNTQNVTVNFLGWNGRAPLIAVILGTAVVAILFDELLGFFWRRGRRRRVAERNELQRLRSEQPKN